MQIESVRVQGYRSLYDVTLEPRSFNVLVGANNAGKSNLLDALHFIGEVHRHGIDIAVARKGGFENIAYRKKRRTKRPISFEVNLLLEHLDVRLRPGRTGTVRRRKVEDHPEVRVRHAFSIGAASQAIDADFRIVDESVRMTIGSRGETREVFRAHWAGGESEPSFEVPDDLLVSDEEVGQRLRAIPQRIVEPMNNESFWQFAIQTQKHNDLLLKTLSYNDYLWAASDALSRTRLHKLAPVECRRPGVPTPMAELELYGGNLPAVVDYLKKHRRREWALVLESMRRIMPNLTDVETQYTTDRRIALQFNEVGFGRPWSVEDISDGTVQSLALFCALFDPRSLLTLIEEPENSVHPWIIRVFAEACRKVNGKAVLVTTHSPVLVNNLEPSEVDVAWRRDGQTHVKPLTGLDPGATQLWEQGSSTVFELLDSGWLPEAVPAGNE